MKSTEFCEEKKSSSLDLHARLSNNRVKQNQLTVITLLYCAEISQRWGVRNPPIVPPYHRALSIPPFDHTCISPFNQIPQCKKHEEAFRKVCAIPFQIFLLSG